MAKGIQNSIEAADPAPTGAVYRVLSPILHGTTADDQRRYEPGDTIVLSDDNAALLLACGAVCPAE